MARSCISRINAALTAAGVAERLVRNLRGGSYYYVTGGEIQCSIYAYRLDPEDYPSTAADVNAAFIAAGRPAPIAKD